MANCLERWECAVAVAKDADSINGEIMTDTVKDNGTAMIYKMLTDQLERQRAMMLSWVDDDERMLGFGIDEDKPPRTSQIRSWWKNQGSPDLRNM